MLILTAVPMTLPLRGSWDFSTLNSSTYMTSLVTEQVQESSMRLFRYLRRPLAIRVMSSFRSASATEITSFAVVSLAARCILCHPNCCKVKTWTGSYPPPLHPLHPPHDDLVRKIRDFLDLSGKNDRTAREKVRIFLLVAHSSCRSCLIRSPLARTSGAL